MLTEDQARDIREILDRRANEISGFLYEYEKDPKHYGSVQLALVREIGRLRDLANVVIAPFIVDEDEE